MSYTTVLSNIPKKITAGESVSWSVTLGDYPASSGWVVTYTLVKSDARIQIVSTASGDAHLVEIPFATTAAYDAGKYHYQTHVSNGVERYQVGEGVIEVLPDFATQETGYDGRSHVKKVLDALEAVIENRASKTQMVQEVAGVQIQHMTTDQIIKLRDQYYSKYMRECAASGRAKTRRTIKPRFRS
jgi:hypothetical protein